jgi:two-component system LytT family sensor kinase
MKRKEYLSMKLYDKWFLSGQLFLWLSVALVTRFAWIAAHPPSWLWIFAYTGLGLLISSLVFPLLKILGEKSFFQQIFFSLIVAIAAGLIWRVLFNIVEYHLLESANNQFEFWGYFHNGKSAVTQLLLWVVAYWGIFYYHNYWHQKHRAELAELETKAALLKLLQYQINPHFLFNVLGNLDTLLLKKDVAIARQMLTRLTDYLRVSLESEPSIAVTLDAELARVRTYLDIEKIRFGERIQVNWCLPEALPKIEIPNGILIPIVENALKHGDLASLNGGVLNIKVRVDDKSCFIQMSNGKIDKADNPGFGIGLNNTRQRLLNFYQGLASLSIDSSSTRYSIAVRVPIP